MDRELVLVTLLCALCGPALLVASWLPLRLAPVVSARELEARAWRRLWLAMLPAALVLAFLIGWALQEPEASEEAAPLVLGTAVVFGAIWIRAIVRAVRAVRHRPVDAVAMTTGLVRPRVSIAPALAVRLDDAALYAALEHEAAHARHRDPLRLWAAQIATDLQWPSRAARRRFDDWRKALELARDAEACEHVDGSDLAAALIEAARMTTVHDPAIAGLVTGAEFSDRIHRLLDHPAETAPRRSWIPAVALAMVALAVVAGSAFGEAVIAILPGLG
jgi:hypothetical protein